MNLAERTALLHRELDALTAAVARERDARLRALQQAARALRQADSTSQWVRILDASAAPLAAFTAFFRVEGNGAVCETVRGGEIAPPGRVALDDAPAFRQAVETRDTVVCVWADSQLSAPVAALWEGKRAHLFPLNGKSRVLGVLLAAGDTGVDSHALEVLLSLAASSLELRETKNTGPGLVAGPAAAPTAGVVEADDAEARWFATKAVAGWIDSRSAAIALGRGNRNLYKVLQREIDGSRAAYRSRFQTGAKPLPDLLHREMVTALASGDEAMMGPGYPGPMVVEK